MGNNKTATRWGSPAPFERGEQGGAMKIAIVGAATVALAKGEGRDFAFIMARREDAANQNANPRVSVVHP